MSVIARASLVEYFKDQLEGALAQQRVPVHADTAHYVVQLLADTMRHDRHGRAAALLDPRPLALRLAAAMDDRCPAPGQALRDVADAALLLGLLQLGGILGAQCPGNVLPPRRRLRLRRPGPGITGAGADLQGPRGPVRPVCRCAR